jgi:hypothetical protein
MIPEALLRKEGKYISYVVWGNGREWHGYDPLERLIG